MSSTFSPTLYKNNILAVNYKSNQSLTRSFPEKRNKFLLKVSIGLIVTVQLLFDSS